MKEQWDCVIVGGGAAGLSAAVVLGRARRRTLVVDAGKQSNLPAHGIGGLLGNDGMSPSQFYERGRDELATYPSVKVCSDEVISAEAGFTLKLASGATEHSRTMLLATGMDYELPDLHGIEQLWGRSVFHCPFCHGWEARDQPLAVLANGDKAMHSALLLRNWTHDVVIVSNGPSGLDAANAELLRAARIQVDEREIAALVVKDAELAAIEFADGSYLPRAGALVAAMMRQRPGIGAQLGAATVAGPLAADAIVIDELHRTSVRGLFAAGDVTAKMPQVVAAIAAGSMAAMAVMRTLLADDVGLPTPGWPVAAAESGGAG